MAPRGTCCRQMCSHSLRVSGNDIHWHQLCLEAVPKLSVAQPRSLLRSLSPTNFFLPGSLSLLAFPRWGIALHTQEHSPQAWSQLPMCLGPPGTTQPSSSSSALSPEGIVAMVKSTNPYLLPITPMLLPAHASRAQLPRIAFFLLPDVSMLHPA